MENIRSKVAHTIESGEHTDYLWRKRCRGLRTNRWGSVAFGILALFSSACGSWPSRAVSPADVVADNAFVDNSEQLGPSGAVRGWGGLAAFDYDNDGDIDLFVPSGPGTLNRLLQNNGNASFTDVADQAGVTMTADNCVTCTVGDFNNDGWLDLLVARQRADFPDGSFWNFALHLSDLRPTQSDTVVPVMLLNNGADAEGQVTFRTLTGEQTGLMPAGPAMALATGDFDNDGWLDVLVGRYDMSQLDPILATYPSQPNELWQGLGVELGIPRFQRVEGAGIEGTEQVGVTPDTRDERFVPGTFVLYPTDVDGDGWLDFFDLHDVPGGIDLFHNNGDLTFSRQQIDLLNKHGGWMGMSGGDFDSDGDIDYFATNVGADALMIPGVASSPHNTPLRPNGTPFHVLLRNDGGALIDVASITEVVPSTVLPSWNRWDGRGLQAMEFGWGCTWIDTDNRGLLDLYWVGDLLLMPSCLVSSRADFHGVGRFLANDGANGFRDQTAERGLFDLPHHGRIAFGYNEFGRSVAARDLNGDGFRDLVVVHSTIFATRLADVRILLNPAASTNHWLTVRLVGSTSNRFGIGAMVRATIGEKTLADEIVATTGTATAVHPEAHFGLGSADTIDKLEIRWPSGIVTTLQDVPGDQVLIVPES